MTEPLDDAHPLGREMGAFHRSLKKYPDAFEALHYFWNEAFARPAPVPQCEAEPVAWQIIGADGSPSSVTREPDLVKSWNENCYKYRPLYAAPPSRSDAGSKTVVTVGFDGEPTATNPSQLRLRAYRPASLVPPPSGEATRKAHEAFDRMLRANVIEECVDAARAAYSDAMKDYVLTGPAGIAGKMLNAIRALSTDPGAVAVTSQDRP